MTKWQLRSKAFTEEAEPSISLIEAAHIKPLDGGGLAFTDETGTILVLVQKDSWIDVVLVPEI